VTLAAAAKVVSKLNRRQRREHNHRSVAAILGRDEMAILGDLTTTSNDHNGAVCRQAGFRRYVKEADLRSTVR